MPEMSPSPSSAHDPRIKRYVMIAVGVAVVLAAWGILSRLYARIVLEHAATDAAVFTVATVHPSRGPGSDVLVLPGNVQAFYEAPIYARTAGYLRSWSTDIGTTVKKGQLLAQIDAPEVDQQLRQAEADLATARANHELARSTNERWQGLLATESVSKQDADERAGDAAAKAAAEQSAAANLARLKDLEAFKRVVAPFDGVVTQRNTDVGALINAGESPGSALFRVADTHRLRIYTSVPQSYAAQVQPGQAATLVFADHPGQRFEAQVASTARALDASSRTLQVELQIDNARGELLPGSYAEVHFDLKGGATLRVPANTVLFRSQGLLVAVVDSAGHAHLRPINQGRDFGKEIEVLSGIEATDDLIVNPPDSLRDGMQVRIATPASTGAASSGHG
jgi:RND family efflux transporter MFP subunit